MRIGAWLMPVVFFVGGLAGTAAIGLWPGQNEGVSGHTFGMCGGPPHRNCVIDGDTFYLGRQSIRIADIDAPETHPPRCAHEADLGMRASRRLRELLNSGSFDLVGEGQDRYGRQLRTIVRDGRSLGNVLVSEGLARRWTGRRMPWCG